MEAKSLAKTGYDIARRSYVSRPVVNDVKVSHLVVLEGIPSCRTDCVKSLLDAIEKSIVRAERDNDLIYHQDVPPISAIPSIQDVSMVQSAVPPGLQDPRTALGSDDVIFGDLVSWGAKVAVG